MTNTNRPGESHPNGHPVPATGDPVMIAPDGGRLITGGAVHARLLVAHDHPSYASTFEMTVALRHRRGARRPVLRARRPHPPDWHAWRSSSGQNFLHGLPGSFLYVPAGVPHAFANRTDRPVTLFFQSSVTGGHENYFTELGALLRDSHGHPDPAAIKQLEASYDTQQLTAMRPGGQLRP